MFFQMIRNLKIPMPLTFVNNKNEDIEKIWDKITYPLVIKPYEKDLNLSFWRLTGSKAMIVKDRKKLKKFYDKISSSSSGFLIQEKIQKTHEFSWIGYIDKKGEKIGVTVRKTRQIPPGGSTTFAEFVDIPEIYGSVDIILENIEYWGICEIEYLYDSINEKYIFLEFNPRACLWFYLTTAGGFNLPYMSYNDIYFNLGIPSNIKININSKWMDLSSDFRCHVLQNGYIEGKFLKRFFIWMNDLGKNLSFSVISKSDIKLDMYIIKGFFKTIINEKFLR